MNSSSVFGVVFTYRLVSNNSIMVFNFSIFTCSSSSSPVFILNNLKRLFSSFTVSSRMKYNHAYITSCNRCSSVSDAVHLISHKVVRVIKSTRAVNRKRRFRFGIFPVNSSIFTCWSSFVSHIMACYTPGLKSIQSGPITVSIRLVHWRICSGVIQLYSDEVICPMRK